MTREREEQKYQKVRGTGAVRTFGEFTLNLLTEKTENVVKDTDKFFPLRMSP